MTVTNGSPFLWQVPSGGDGSPDGFKRVRAYKVRPDHIVDDLNRLWELLHRSGLWHAGLHADLLDGKHLSEIYTYLATIYQPLCARLTTLCDDGELSLLASLLDTVPNIYAGGSPTYGIAVGADFVSIVMGGVSKLKVAADGKVTIPGLIDPTGLELTPGAANPGGTAANTLWADSGAGNRFKVGTNTLAYLSEVGTGDVTAASAFANDNRVIRSDGTGKGVQASGITVDDSDNVSGVGTLASGAHTITQATEQAKALGVKTTLDTSYYEERSIRHDRVQVSGTASDSWSITPVADGHYFIEAELKIECLTSGGAPGDPAVGATAFRKSIATIKVVGGTVTLVGSQTDLHNASETGMTGLALTIGAGMGVITIAVAGGTAGNTYDVTRTVLISESTT